MPQMDGIEATRRLHAELSVDPDFSGSRNIPAWRTFIRFQQVGGAGYFVKGADTQRLIAHMLGLHVKLCDPRVAGSARLGAGRQFLARLSAVGRMPCAWEDTAHSLPNAFALASTACDIDLLLSLAMAVAALTAWRSDYTTDAAGTAAANVACRRSAHAFRGAGRCRHADGVGAFGLRSFGSTRRHQTSIQRWT